MLRRFFMTAAVAVAAATSASAQFIGYDNTTTSLASTSNGGSALQGTNTITRLIADRITMVSGGLTVNSLSFSVTNLNATAVTVQPRVRLFADDNTVTPGTPGTIIAGFSFGGIAFAGNTRTLLTANVAPVAIGGNSGTFWAGITYDNVNNTTGATLAQLDNFGMAVFDPPTVGSSTNNFFRTTAAGSFLANNPVGGLLQFTGGTPVANLGWRFGVTAIPEPGSVALMGLAGLAAAWRLRRRVSA